MGALLPIILSLLGSLPGVFGKVFSKQADVSFAALDLQKEVIKAQILQAGEMAKAQLQYQTAALHSTMPLFKQHMFWFLSLPILWSVFLPSRAHDLWNNIGLVPEWYRTLYASVVLTIWGIPIASGWLSGIFNNIGNYASQKRADNIELQRVSSDQYKAALADAMRTVSRDGKIGNAEWEKVSAALDKMGEPPRKAG